MEISYRLEMVNHRSEKDLLLRPFVEIFYAVEGNGRALVDGEIYPLLKNEILLINFGSSYKIEFGYDAVLARLQIDYFELLKITGKSHWNFRCDTASDHGRSHYYLRHAFSRMLRAHIMGDRILEERGAFYDLLSILTSITY